VTSGTSTETPFQTIRIITSDPDLYAYLEDCIARIPGVQVLPDHAGTPDLIVTDIYNPFFREDRESVGIPRLHVLDEPPVIGKSEPVEFILTPFDARSVAHAVLRALRQ
jgi:hypothetical protein